MHAHAHATSSEAVSKRACKCVDARRTQKCERAHACKECWSEGESTSGRASKSEQDRRSTSKCARSKSNTNMGPTVQGGEDA